MTFSGRVAMVTGGTGDIGQAVLRRLTQAGLQVAFTFHSNQDAAQALCREIGEQVKAFQVQRNDLAEAREIIATLRQDWGPVDYLVTCAGLIRDRMFVRLEEEDWRDVLDANLHGAFVFSRAIVFEQLKQQKGAMVHVSSVAALTGAAGQTNYAAAKAGILGFTKSLARETGPFGIRVNAVAPGYIQSRMTDQLPEKIKKRAHHLIPLARFGTPEEVAAAIVFLLSEEARYITGQVLVVDGGLVMP